LALANAKKSPIFWGIFWRSAVRKPNSVLAVIYLVLTLLPESSPLDPPRRTRDK